MDPIKKSYSRFRYTQETLEKALNAILRGEISINKASKAYNIPKSTLHNKINNKVPWQRKMGPNSELGFEEERKLARWILNKAKVGFPMHPEEVYDTVKDFLDTNQRNTKFTDNRPGRKWLSLFLNRHQDVTKRNAELISKARAAVTEESLRKWFLELDKFLAEENLLDIKEDPSRIFNADETGIMTCPKTGLILGPKNYKNTYEIATSAEKESITVLCTFAANGTDVPPFVVYPYKRMPPAVVHNFPDSWHIGRSDSGWMVSETFLSYIVLFYEWLVQNNTKIPVLLFLDGHKSHINEKMFNFCSEKKIFLYCLHPNATHIIQPCDVGIFGPLKKSWKKVARKHKQKTTAPITKQSFAGKFKEAYDKSIKAETIQKAFRTCGLFPIDPNAVDYSKCINTRRQEIAKEQNNMDASISDDQKDDLRSTMRVIENEVGHIIKNEFMQSYNINRSHEHYLYGLWSKCKLKLENRGQSTETSSATDIPLDLSNTSTQCLAESSNKDQHPSSPNPSSPVVVTVTEAQTRVCSDENNIEADPPVLSKSCSILLDDDILFESGIGLRFDTTDEIVNFIIEKEKNKSPIPLPWYDTFSQITSDELITSFCDINSSTAQTYHSEVIMPDTSQCTNFVATVSSEGPSVLNSKDDGDLIDPFIHDGDADKPEITFQEKVVSTHVLGDSNLNISSTPSSTIVPKRKVPIENFLSYPQIETKKKKTMKKEPMPFGLTGRKFKEYLEKLDIAKEKKEEDKKNKKKERDARIECRREITRNNKNLQKKNTTPLRLQQKKKKETDQNAQNENEDIQRNFLSTSVSSDNHPPHNIICGKYVIVHFKTEKRIRSFVGKILMIDDERLKCKIDFLRKKKVVENVVSFVKPQVPDISEVHVSDIVRVLDEPNCSRRGMISFTDVSFKDIE